MKLGTQTGSLTNHILSRATIGQPEPVVGMGATLLAWTDRHAATIILVTNGGAMLTVQEDKVVRTDSGGPFTETQRYSYEANPAGAIHRFRKNKAGGWDEVSLNQKTNRWVKTGGYGLRIGERMEHRDPSF